MTDWISLNSLTRTENGGKAATITLADTAKVLIESSPSHQDVRVETDEHIVSVQLAEDYRLDRILVDDVAVWSRYVPQTTD